MADIPLAEQPHETLPANRGRSGSAAPGQKRHLIIVVVLAFVAGLALLSCYGLLTTSYVFKVEGDSMLPTLESEQRVLVNRAIYAVGAPQRGDIVVFEAWREPKDFIKRVIALEGETVEIKPDLDSQGEPNPDRECGGCGVFVNEVKLNEPYIRQTPNYTVEPVVVPKDHVFVLGDNRRNSSDSHVPENGPLNVDRIKGKAFFSLNPFGSIENAAQSGSR